MELYEYQLRLSELYKEACELPWYKFISRYRVLSEAERIEKEMFEKYPEEKE